MVIAGEDKANPIGAILSMAMMLRYSLELSTAADLIEAAVHGCLQAGLRTADLGAGANGQVLGTEAFGDAVIAEIDSST